MLYRLSDPVEDQPFRGGFSRVSDVVGITRGQESRGLVSSPHRRLFDLDSWDGSAFFMERPDSAERRTGTMFVSDKVVSAFNAADIQGARLVRLSEADLSASVVQIGLKHRFTAALQAKIDQAIAAHEAGL